MRDHLCPEPAAVEVSALHNHTLGKISAFAMISQNLTNRSAGHNKRSRRWSTPLVLDTSLKNTSNGQRIRQFARINNLAPDRQLVFKRVQVRLNLKILLTSGLMHLVSDTESTVSESEPEQDKNEGTEAQITKEWESVLQLKESAHQTEIEILNDEHKADKELLEKSLTSEIERLKRNMKVQKQDNGQESREALRRFYPEGCIY